MDKERKWNLKNFKPTLFGGMVLLILLGMLFNVWHKGKNPLLNERNAITLFEEIQAGQGLTFRTEDFFGDDDLDLSKISYDTSYCDPDTPGTYDVPVLYDGEETNCVVRVTVKGPVEETQGENQLSITTGD